MESAAFGRVQEGIKKIVLGNRGTGKSAIFKVLAERQRQQGTLVLELGTEDYSYEMLASVLATEAEGSWAKHGAYSAAWKYLIFVLTMKALADASGKGKRGTSESDVHKFLRDHFKDQSLGRLDALFRI